jgi:hypothetical protein
MAWRLAVVPVTAAERWPPPRPSAARVARRATTRTSPSPRGSCRARLRQHLANVYAFARWSRRPRRRGGLAGRGGRRARGRGDEQLRRLLRRPRARTRCFVALAETVRADRPRPSSPSPICSRRSRRIGHSTRPASPAAMRAATRCVGYCRRSADPVGRIVLGAGGLPRCRGWWRCRTAICTGLQLVNFWQDVRRDRLAGRVYLPARRHGGGTAWTRRCSTPRPPARPCEGLLARGGRAWARRLLRRGGTAGRRSRPRVLAAGDRHVSRPGGGPIADAIERAGL